MNFIPIFNHFDVSSIKHADDLPEFDISGIWYCGEEKSFVYFGKNNSQYMWVGKKNESGNFYLSVTNDIIQMHMYSDKTVTKDKCEIKDSERILLGGRLFVKL
jgi:hypothetical protein